MWAAAVDQVAGEGWRAATGKEGLQGARGAAMGEEEPGVRNPGGWRAVEGAAAAAGQGAGRHCGREGEGGPAGRGGVVNTSPN